MATVVHKSQIIAVEPNRRASLSSLFGFLVHNSSSTGALIVPVSLKQLTTPSTYIYSYMYVY